MKTLIVMPIGVSVDGTPVQKLLEQSVESILAQSDKNFKLIVAADKNVPDRCLEYLASKGVDVKFFEEFSWFRKGSSWKKVSNIWQEESDYDNIAFCHYDDLWHVDKLKIQHNLMQNENLLGSWTNVHIINGENMMVTGDCAFNELNKTTVGSRFAGFAHSCIVNRNALIESGFFKHEDEWAGNFEDLWAIYMHKIRNIKKANGAITYWRDHSMNMSTTHTENTKYVVDQRAITNYTLEETMNDAKFIQDIITEERSKWQN